MIINEKNIQCTVHVHVRREKNSLVLHVVSSKVLRSEYNNETILLLIRVI